MSRNLIYAIMMIILAACGDVKVTDGVGEQRRFEPKSLYPQDLDRLKAVCKALENMEDDLVMTANNSVPFVFDYGEKTCAAETIESFNTITAKIRNVTGSPTDFEYFTDPGTSFGYRLVESTKTGLMKDVCSNLTAGVSPITKGNSSAIWFGSVQKNKDCESTADAICVLIEYGKKIVDQDYYEINTRESIKFNIKSPDPREGFFTERKTFSSVGCAAGLQIEKTAIAK